MALRAVYALRAGPRRYVGFSVSPGRRLRQHNAGRRGGGARATSGRGPWEMLLYVYGFPSDVAALRFEWAWQHPATSRRLRDVTPRRRGEQPIAFALRVLPRLLRAPPWCRLPLRVRWLRPPPRPSLSPAPPPHVVVEEGPPHPHRPRRRPPPLPPAPDTPPPPCDLCGGAQQEASPPPLRCPRPPCAMAAHPPCLARLFLRHEPRQLLPVGGRCPRCHAHLLWGDLIRHSRGERVEPDDHAPPDWPEPPHPGGEGPVTAPHPGGEGPVTAPPPPRVH